MTRYFFNVINGTGRTEDHEGTELASLDEARSHAVEGIRSLIAEEVQSGTIDLTGRIEVMDDDGALALIIRFADAVRVGERHP